MAMLAVLIPPLMLGLVLALGRYEELLLAEQDTDLPAPIEPAPARSPASAPGIPVPSIAHHSRELLDTGLPRV
ncbi:hypothetical protein ACFYPC_30680 [Streptomyces sp. NPDC005808]|uniref:hypothetical protein n=1 Tax=Streptomyces sp. NPDC005808 TaxID=3364734 RepID=UPI003690381B